MTTTRLLLLLLLLAACAMVPPDARAADGYDNCTGFIDALPAVIGSQGTWCLRGHLGTNISEGAAIGVVANNVTIDCNGFKVGNLAAGTWTQAVGVQAADRNNVTVRHCTLRGFYNGVEMLDGSGYLVEYNRIEQARSSGIRVAGEGSLVYRNQVISTGNRYQYARGIWATADVIENVVSGVAGSANHPYSIGMSISGGSKLVRGNTVRGLVVDTDYYGFASGIDAHGTNMVLADNHIVGPGAGNHGSNGLWTDENLNTFCRNNTVTGFENNYSGCVHVDGNLALP